jgi:thiol-disulfide isomerase/thioredoxin
MKHHHVSALAFALLGLVSAPSRAVAQDGGLPIGSTIPAAMVHTLDGKQVPLNSAIGSGPAVIEFWAAWCENCEKLLPAMQKAEAKYRGKVKFVGVAVSVNETPNRVRLHVAKHKVPGAQFFDYSGDATEKWDVPATSHVVVVDKKGKVVYTGVGADQDIEAAIKKAL